MPQIFTAALIEQQPPQNRLGLAPSLKNGTPVLHGEGLLALFQLRELLACLSVLDGWLFVVITLLAFRPLLNLS